MTPTPETPVERFDREVWDRADKSVARAGYVMPTMKAADAAIEATVRTWFQAVQTAW